LPDFTGFGAKALPFLKALKFHQTKAWFDENRALYESDLLEPMVALLDELTVRFAKSRIPLKANGRRSVFRINRDIRFSKDKSPYKTHCGAVMTRSGAKNEQGLLYLHIEPEGSFVAAGFYMPEADQLGLLRKRVVAKPKVFATMEATLATGGLQMGSEMQLTRVPRGFEAHKGTAIEGALRRKSFIVEETLPAKLLATPKLADAVTDFAVRAKPLLTFGWEALGYG
jgi:uncharacterized protein (TIGR02453 family)